MGDIFTEKWFTSSSKTPNDIWLYLWLEWKQPWRTKCIFIIDGKSGKIIPWSVENEVLFDKWTNFKVSKIDEKAWIKRYFIEETNEK